MLESVFICMAPFKKIDSIFRAAWASEMTGTAKVKMIVTGMVQKCLWGVYRAFLKFQRNRLRFG